MYVHKIIVAIATTEADPAKVAVTTGLGLGLMLDGGHGVIVNTYPAKEFYAVNAEPSNDPPRVFEIIDEPREPNNDHDDWLDNVVDPLMDGR